MRAAWSSDHATDCRRLSCTKSRRAGRSSRHTGRSFISTLRHLGEELIETKLPMVRAVPAVRAHRSGQGADPGPPGRALHDGRRAHRHQRRDTPSTGCTRPVRPRATINGANRLGSTAAGVPWPRRPSRQPRNTPTAAAAVGCRPLGRRRGAAARSDAVRPGNRAHRRTSANRCSRLWRTVQDSGPGDSPTKGVDLLAELQHDRARPALRSDPGVHRVGRAV